MQGAIIAGGDATRYGGQPKGLLRVGGVRILDRLERQQFDVFGRRPALGFADGPAIVWGMVTWA